MVHAPLHRIEGLLIAGISDQLAKEAAAFLAADGGIEAGGGQRLTQQAIELFKAHAQFGGDLPAAGHGAQFVSQVHRCFAHRGQALTEVNRQADRAGLAGDRPGHALTDPPEGISRELVATGGVELLNGPFQAQGTLLDQIQQLQAFALIFLGNAHHQAQVGFHHPLLGAAANTNQFLFAGGVGGFLALLHQRHHGLNLVPQLDLLRRSQQWNPADTREVPADGVIAPLAAVFSCCERACGHGEGWLRK